MTIRSIRKVGVLNCGVGNIGSIVNSLSRAGFEPKSVTKRGDLQECNRLIMPGVGSFASYMGRVSSILTVSDISEFVDNNENLLIGICIGMQVLLSYGTEGRRCDGLNFIQGSVLKISENAGRLRVPHVGWNHVSFNDPVLKSFDGDYYFTHSYVAHMDSEYVLATFDYGNTFVAATKKRNIYGLQFHPEKSGELGERLLLKLCENLTC